MEMEVIQVVLMANLVGLGVQMEGPSTLAQERMEYSGAPQLTVQVDGVEP